MDKNGELVDGKGTYQIRKLRAALARCREFRVAVDVGAHVGLWSMQLAKKFSRVEAFEPVQVFRDCFIRNAMQPAGVGVIALHEYALGAAPGKVRMAYDPADSGGTHVGGDGDIEMRTLDSFELQNVDFIKIDCEGYEHHVLEGARETLKRCMPTIIVEQKPHKLGPNFGIKGRPAVDLLLGLGYQVATEMSGDFIMVPQ